MILKRWKRLLISRGIIIYLNLFTKGQILFNVYKAKKWLIKGNFKNVKAQNIFDEFELLLFHQSQDSVDGSELQKVWFKYFIKMAESEQSLNHLSKWLQGDAEPQALLAV